MQLAILGLETAATGSLILWQNHILKLVQFVRVKELTSWILQVKRKKHLLEVQSYSYLSLSALR